MASEPGTIEELREQNHQAMQLLLSRMDGYAREVQDLHNRINGLTAVLADLQGLMAHQTQDHLRLLAIMAGKPEDVQAAVKEAAIQMAKSAYADKGV